MKKYSVLVSFSILVVLLICILQIPVSVAQPSSRVAGVKVGDWVIWQHYTIKASSDPEVHLPNSDKFLSMQGKITILGVSVTNFTVQDATYYIDGTSSIPSPRWLDVATGKGTYGNGIIISANLTSGDQVYTVEPTNWIINETTTRTYLGEARQVNHVNITELYTSTNYETKTVRDFFWDKTSGVLTEGRVRNVATNKTSNYVTTDTMYWLVIDTNLWGYRKKSTEYSELANTFNNLQTDYNNLNNQYNSLNSAHNNLQDSYQSLQNNYTDLNGKYGFLQGESSVLRNLTYIFVVTTIALVGTSIYFATRRTRVKP